jgi:NAD(P)H-dependent FMN reductase
VASADAFVFVIPEYNHSINAATKNAIDYLHGEWKYKPAIVASYGGVSGGLRATQALKPVLATLKISHVADLPISLPVTPVENGVFGGNDLLRAGLTAALNEALLMTTALATRRQS